MPVGSDYRAALAAAGIGYYPIYQSNFAPLKRTFTFRDVDLTADTFAGQVRVGPDAVGAALASLTITKNYVAPHTHVTVELNEATVEGLPAANVPGENSRLYWDMQHTPSGGVKATVLAGEFWRVAGVTQ